MSASGQSIVGDIIEIEHTDDHTASDPTWDVVGKTHDAVETSPNTSVADQRLTGDTQLDKAATDEAWEIAFAANIVTGTAQLETLGLIDSSTYELKGHVDSRETDNAADALQVTVYEDEAAKSSGTPKWQIATPEYILVNDGGSVEAEDFSSRDFTVHSLVRPIRIDAGGSL